MEINKLMYENNEMSMMPTVTDVTLADGTDKVIKFTNGVMMIVGVRNYAEMSITSGWGSIFEGPLTNLGTFSEPFTSTPTITMNVIGSADLLIQSVKNTSATSIGQAYFSSGSSKSCSPSINFIAIGRWK